jgi:hypothetical protein
VGRSSGAASGGGVNPSRRTAYDLPEQGFGGIAALLVFLGRHLRHVGKSSLRLPRGHDARPGDGRRLCRLALCHRHIDDRSGWSRLPCRDDPHWNSNRDLALWRALPAVVCSDDDGWLGGHRQGLGEWYHGEMPAGWGTRAYPAGKGPGRKTHDVCRCDYVPAILLCRKLRGVFSWKPGQQLGRNQKSPARASGRDGVKFRKSQCAGQLPDKPR